MKLVTKMLLGCSALAGLVVSVSLVGLRTGMHAQDAATAVVERDIADLDLVTKVDGAFVSARAHAEAFWTHRRPEDVKHFDADVAQVETVLKQLGERLSGGPIEPTATSAKEAAQAYSLAVAHMVECYKARGLDEKSGFEGALRAAAHEVEGMSKAFDRIDLTAAYLQVRRNEKDYLLRLDQRYVQQARAAIDAFMATAESGDKNPELVARATAAWKTYYDALVALAAGVDKLAVAREKGDEAAAAFGSRVSELAASVRQRVARDCSATAATMTGNARLLLVVLGLATLIAVGLGYWLARSVQRPVRAILSTTASVFDGERCDLRVRFAALANDEFGQMGSSLNQLLEHVSLTVAKIRASCQTLERSSAHVKSSSTALANSASNQAASVEEVSAAVTEVSTTMRTNHEHVEHANKLSLQACDAASRGSKATERLGAAMERTQAAALEIERVLSVIDGIAFQTNLLALNAAVEAARAGDAGKGFAVVAEEVRSLAQRSASAARDTKKMIDESIASVRENATESAQVRQVFGDIDGRIQEVRTLFEQITAVSGEQARGINQIADVTHQVDNNAQATAAQSEELSATAQCTSDAAVGMMALVERFVVDEEVS